MNVPQKGGDVLPSVPEPSSVLNIQLECDQTTMSLEQLQVAANEDDPPVQRVLTSSRAGGNLDDTRVCVDLGYAWPSEARPAKERQGAVATQLANFAEIVKKHTTDSSSGFKVHVCGPGTTAISDKLRMLAPVIEVEPSDLFDSSLQSSDEVVDYLYLSPDAEEFLDTSRGWPRSDGSGRRVVLVVGGIVDRKVKRGRSTKRVADVQVRPRADASVPNSNVSSSTVRAVQLPLVADDLGAPLNIDTVLTMLYYWKVFDGRDRVLEVDGSRKSSSSGSSSGCNSNSNNGSTIPKCSSSGSTHIARSSSDSSAEATSEPQTLASTPVMAVGKAFEAARHCAMYEHQQRHPQQGKHLL